MRLCFVATFVLFVPSVVARWSLFQNKCFGAKLLVQLEDGPELCEDAYDVVHRTCSANWKIPEITFDYFASHHFSQPKITFQNSKDKLYTVLLLDPDAPSHENPEFRNWIHWGVTNIPGAELSCGLNSSTGETFVEYEGPTPPKGSGKHRYEIIVLEQDGATSEVPKLTNRKNFNFDKFVTDWKLEEVARSSFVTQQA